LADNVGDNHQSNKLTPSAIQTQNHGKCDLGADGVLFRPTAMAVRQYMDFQRIENRLDGHVPIEEINCLYLHEEIH
jgi:hypothetical protein